MPNRNIKNISGERFQLLNSFKAIYENGSISDAAHTLGITQSAASKHLQKLREWFGDELFVRTTQGMEPTEKAIDIVERVDNILQEISLLTESSAFDPLRLQGSMTIATTSEISQRLVPELLKIFNQQAPQLRLRIIRLANDFSIRELESGKVDFVISVNWHAPEQLIQKRLFDDHFVCVMHKKNPLTKRPLTLESFAEAKHIMIAPLAKQRGLIDKLLDKYNLQRYVQLSLPDFSLIEPELLKENIITLPYQIASDLRKKGDISLKKLPIEVPDITYYLFWHKRFQQDQTKTWMREIIQSVLGQA